MEWGVTSDSTTDGVNSGGINLFFKFTVMMLFWLILFLTKKNTRVGYSQITSPDIPDLITPFFHPHTSRYFLQANTLFTQHPEVSFHV